MSLLTLSFTSLSWKDATNCHRTASLVCWTLLRQVAHLIYPKYKAAAFFDALITHVAFMHKLSGYI